MLTAGGEMRSVAAAAVTEPAWADRAHDLELAEGQRHKRS